MSPHYEGSAVNSFDIESDLKRGRNSSAMKPALGTYALAPRRMEEIT